jgi:hypothetical protein
MPVSFFLFCFQKMFCIEYTSIFIKNQCSYNFISPFLVLQAEMHLQSAVYFHFRVGDALCTSIVVSLTICSRNSDFGVDHLSLQVFSVFAVKRYCLLSLDVG